MGAVICDRWTSVTQVAKLGTEYIENTPQKGALQRSQPTIRKYVPTAYFEMDWGEDAYLQEK